MIRWVPLMGQDHVMYPSDGFRPVDEMTGLPPIGKWLAFLDIDNHAGGWIKTGISPVITSSGVIAYPALGRRRDPSGSQTYRLRIKADYYRPWYRRNADGVEFSVPFYNDTNPPTPLPQGPIDLMLQPAANYPFQTHIPVLHGVIKDIATNQPVPDVVVRESMRERVLSDDFGSFSLPLRRVRKDAPVNIDIEDFRNNRTRNIVVTLPDGLGQCLTVVL